MIGDLPSSIEVGGKEWEIRSDYRIVLRIVQAMNDPDLEDKEKVFLCLYLLYEDFGEMNELDYEEAFKKASDFIDNGNKVGKRCGAKVIDFEQDENLIIPAVNRVAGKEIRELEYLHWWTFLGYLMEIGDCVYSTILGIRSKKASGKKLDNWEQEFYIENKDLCVIKEKLSTEEREMKERMERMLS